jgi:hypothetical protein
LDVSAQTVVVYVPRYLHQADTELAVRMLTLDLIYRYTSPRVDVQEDLENDRMRVMVSFDDPGEAVHFAMSHTSPQFARR